MRAKTPRMETKSRKPESTLRSNGKRFFGTKTKDYNTHGGIIINISLKTSQNDKKLFTCWYKHGSAIFHASINSEGSKDPQPKC